MPTPSSTPRIGLLATGNELTEGDILNRNGQTIARSLTEQGLRVGLHVITSDAETDIATALQFLLDTHTAVIITGGLGPTSDDRTRYALSDVIQQPLVFDDASWQHIGERYQQAGLKLEPHPTNRQQAMFPQAASIIPNPHGTAAGCWLTYKQRLIFMLPGPPGECLPMFETHVLPMLQQQLPNPTAQQKFVWRLLGVVESEIAATVDAIAKNHAVTTGYRLDYPYLEVKIYTEPHAKLTPLFNELHAVLAKYLISTDNQTAIDLAKQSLHAFTGKITIIDNATHGWLAAHLGDPQIRSSLHFAPDKTHAPASDILITIDGLQEYWQGQTPPSQTSLSITFTNSAAQETKHLTLPYRNQHITRYAVDYIAYSIHQFLEKLLR